MLETLTTSGIAVLLCILALGAAAAVVFLERAAALHRAHIDETDFIRGVFNTVERGAIREALTLCDETPGPVAHLAAIAISQRGAPAGQISETLLQAGRVEILRMERRVGLLGTIAQTAPLFGLLGTALAIFDGLLMMRRSAPFWLDADAVRCLASGLSTTIAGLLVAIPSFLGMKLLASKIEKLILSMDRARIELQMRLAGREKTEAPDAV